MAISDVGVNTKKEDGKLLYDTLLNKAHNGNFKEMYNYFKKKVERLEIYGDTEEKQLLNYCSFMYEIVLSMYK